ncbi:MAG: hypothetical protein WC565_03555 [Parcubacteria group bacterium]|jgi:hypothetical protein
MDIILHFGELHSWFGQNWRASFGPDTAEITMPRGASRSFDAYSKAINGAYGDRPIKRALKNRGWDKPGNRVAVLGFSETCIGVAVLLSGPDGGAPDFVLACDGIHLMHPAWKRYARLAALGGSGNPNIPPTEHCLVVTSSETPKPPKASLTTEQASLEILDHVMQSPVYLDPVTISALVDADHAPIPTSCYQEINGVKKLIGKYTYTKIPGKFQYKVGGLWLLGYRNMEKTCTDHIYQSKVIAPRVLDNILIPRWAGKEVGGSGCVIL